MLKLKDKYPISQFLSLLNKKEMERIIATMTETILVEIKEKKRTIQEAEQLIFNMSTLELCDKHALNTKLRDIVVQGMELEDINYLTDKETLKQAIDDCLKQIHQLEPSLMNA